MSRVFLNEHERKNAELTRSGHGLRLCYTLQQVAQFRKLGEEFTMQHAGTEYLDEVEGRLQAILEGIPIEFRNGRIHQHNGG